MQFLVVISVLILQLTMLLIFGEAKMSKNRSQPELPKQYLINGLAASSIIVNKLLRKYDRRDPPRIDHATNIKLGIYVNGFDSISEQSMDYSINLYLREEWHDPRLVFTPSTSEERQMIKLGDGMWDKLWVPDVFFRNEKKAQWHNITRPNRLMRLFSDGTVYYASKVTATLACPMRLHKYPLDTQICPMMIESFGHTTDTVTYSWRKNAVEMEPYLQLPQFELESTDYSDCSQNYTTGSYPCLQIDFKLKRNIGYYMIQLYVPSVLIVILSWVAFWISIDAIPARVTIGLLTVLTMTTQSTGARESLPRVSYVKAMDVWMSMCLLFVFSSLLEFAVVNVFSRKEVRKYHVIRSVITHDEEKAHERIHMVGDNIRASPLMKDSEARQKARVIDKLSRKLFPLAFILFNVVYWVSYILW